MAIPSPWESVTTESESESPEAGGLWAPERERERERAHAGAGDYTEDHEAATDAEVVQFPNTSTDVAVRDQPGLPAKLRDASTVWMRDAAQHTREVFDGSVYTVRPPSVRDRVERWRRAEWAGGIDSLRVAGKVAGAVPLALDLLVDAVRWFLTPGRFYIAVAVTCLVLVLLGVW